MPMGAINVVAGRLISISFSVLRAASKNCLQAFAVRGEFASYRSVSQHFKSEPSQLLIGLHMADFDWLSAGATVLGGLLGGSEDAPSQTSTSRIDPRMDPYLYGNSNITGIIPQAYNLYNQNPSGMNQQMADGLNRQWNTYSDPATAQGYTNMQGLGASLMGAPIAGNPFSDGRIALASGTGAGRVGQSSFGQQTYNNPATQSGMSPFSVMQPQKAPAYISGGLLGSLPAQGTSLGAVGLAQADGQGAGPGGVGGGINAGAPSRSFADVTHDMAETAVNNPNVVNTAAGMLGGPTASVISRAVLGLLNMAPAGDGWATGATPNSVGGVHNYGSLGDKSVNAGISTAANQAGMGGYNGAGNGSSANGGGDAGRGSQSSNGGQNGGTSGGW